MIQGLLGNYLRFRSANAGLSNDKHLDDDSLTAFVEGNLSERESTPIVSHLVDCSFCRHVTAELVKLDFAFAGEEAPAPVIESAPQSVSDVLNNLLSRIFGTSDSAVFAHEQKEEKEEEEEEKES
jgi:lipase chaperone LimK